MKLIDYREYCNEVFLTEEKLKDVVERLKLAFPDEHEFTVYNSILDLFPSLAAKSIITSFLIRTKNERHTANVTPQQAKEVFEQLLELIRRNIKVDLSDMIKKDRIENPDGTGSRLFSELTELVHFQIGRIAALSQKKLQKKSGVGDIAQEIDTKFPDPVYVDNEFEVYEAKSPAECKNYMGDSGICLKHPEHFWGTYRIPYASAVYYIFPRTPKSVYMDAKGTRHRFLQIELRVKGDLVWTWEDNLMNNLPSLASLKQKFPELAPLIDKGIFKVRPHAPGEVENFRKVQHELDDESFKHLGYEIRTMYIANGHQLTDGQWAMIDKNQKNAYISFSQNRDITAHQYQDIQQDQSLLKRYITMKKRGLEAKIKSGEFIRVGATPHEAVVLPELLTSVSQSSKDIIVKGLISNIKDVLSGKITPKTDIFGIYELFKGQLLSDPDIKRDDVVRSVAEILAGAKSASWNQVPANVKEGVYKVAKDIYSSNSAEMKPIIDAKIKDDPNLLLHGLISVPTDFQVQFFIEHEKELLSDVKWKDTLDQSILGHLVFGTQLPKWLKVFWNSHKEVYSKDRKFYEKLRYDLQNSIFGKLDRKFPSHAELPTETLEIYDALIDDIWDDPKTMDLVKNTFYEMIILKKADINNMENWPVSDEFKKYFKEHEKTLKEWITFRLVDTPPEHISPELTKLLQQYKDAVLTNQNYRNEIEKRLISDIISNEAQYSWSGDRITYWLENFWDILKRYPGMEESLVNRVKKEFGADRSANAFYTEYGIPYSFYQKYENQILSDPEAYRGLKQKVIDALVWRHNKNATTEQAVESDLSNIEKDFYLKHKKEFPENIVSVNLRGN